MSALLLRRVWIVGLMAAAVAGCAAMKGRKPLLDSSAGMFDKADVTYRVDAARVNQAAATRRVEGQLVSYQPAAENKLPPGATAEVHIAFPHPDKREGYAQVTVKVSGPDSGKSEESGTWWSKVSHPWSAWSKSDSGVIETWTLDIPQNELSKIINDLHNSGYFTAYDKAAEGAQIQTELDGAKVSKAWRQVAQLDALIVRVRTDGRLLSNPKGPASNLFQGLAGSSPSSVAAYRKLNEEEGVAVVSDLRESPAPAAGTFQIVRLPTVDNRVVRR